MNSQNDYMRKRLEQLEADKEYNAQCAEFWRNLLGKHLREEKLTEEEERLTEACKMIKPTDQGRNLNEP